MVYFLETFVLNCNDLSIVCSWANQMLQHIKIFQE